MQLSVVDFLICSFEFLLISLYVFIGSFSLNVSFIMSISNIIQKGYLKFVEIHMKRILADCGAHRVAFLNILPSFHAPCGCLLTPSKFMFYPKTRDSLVNGTDGTEFLTLIDQLKLRRESRTESEILIRAHSNCTACRTCILFITVALLGLHS